MPFSINMGRGRLKKTGMGDGEVVQMLKTVEGGRKYRKKEMDTKKKGYSGSFHAVP